MAPLALLLLHLAAQAEELRFVVVGDTQTNGDHTSINWDVLPNLIEDMNTHDPVVGLFVGDLVGGTGSVSGTEAQWRDFRTATADFSGTLLAVPGNHDVYGGSGTFAAWRDMFDWLPTDDSPPGEGGVTYVWDVDDIRFVSITSDQEVSNPYNVSAAGLNWLTRVLGETEATHTFVMTHHPVSFSTEGGLGHTGEDFWQTLVAHDVVSLFAGHWHRYQPAQLGNGGATWETIIGTGGGWTGFEPIRPEQQRYGFLLVTVDGPEVVAEFYADEDGDGHYDDVLDRYTMRSGEAAQAGLRLRYAFDGLDADDRVPDDADLGAGLHGALGGDATLLPDGVEGGALSLDGDGDYVEGRALDAYRLSLKGDLTLSAWVRPEALANGYWDNAITCFATNDYYSEDEETNYAWWLSLQSDGRPLAFWEHHDGENVTVEAPEAPADATDGRWHHVVAVRDATRRAVQFYWDGALLGDAVPFSQLPTGASRGLLYVGADTLGAGSSEFTGDIDDLCIYDVALDDAEVGARRRDGLHGGASRQEEPRRQDADGATATAATTATATAPGRRRRWSRRRGRGRGHAGRAPGTSPQERAAALRPPAPRRPRLGPRHRRWPRVDPTPRVPAHRPAARCTHGRAAGETPVVAYCPALPRSMRSIATPPGPPPPRLRGRTAAASGAPRPPQRRPTPAAQARPGEKEDPPQAPSPSPTPFSPTSGPPTSRCARGEEGGGSSRPWPALAPPRRRLAHLPGLRAADDPLRPAAGGRPPRAPAGPRRGAPPAVLLHPHRPERRPALRG